MENILVVGATGTTGKHVVDILKNHDEYKVLALVRSQSQIEQFKSQGINTVFGDLTGDISEVAKDIDKVIFAAGSKGKALDEVDRKGAMKVVDTSKKHRIKKFVMLSSIGTNAPEKGGDMQPYLQAKRDADEYLASSGLEFTIVRPGTLNNDMPTGKIRLEKQLKDQSGEIPRADVARVLVDCLADGLRKREVFEILNGEEMIPEALETV